MKKLTTLAFTLLFTVALTAQISESEKSALTDLYTFTNGADWNMKWDMNKSVSDLAGVTIENGHVTEIRMLFNNLEGTLPSSLGQLTKLKILELSFNKITGELPESIGSLKKLEILALNGNDLTGTIPASIGNLSKLKQLHLSSNELTGELPLTLNKLDNLVTFNVFDNQLTGALPLALAASRSIREFVVAENSFNNASDISSILLRNSGGHLDLNENSPLNTTAKTVIATESSEDEN